MFCYRNWEILGACIFWIPSFVHNVGHLFLLSAFHTKYLVILFILKNFVLHLWSMCHISLWYLASIEYIWILFFFLKNLAYVFIVKFMCLHCLYTSCDNWSRCSYGFRSTCLYIGNSWSVSFLQVLHCFHTHHVWSILQIETLLQFLGSAAVVQLVVTKLLYAEVHIYFLSSLVQLTSPARLQWTCS